jgi:C-terminal processing protease CtpA/Prc
VLHVIDDSPAMQSGLLPGDLIIEVGQLSMRGSDFDQVTKSSLWGEVGTEVALVWLRPGAADKMQATIRRVAITDKLKIKRIPGVEIRTPN